jgi:glucan phosphoethanolaminetransferase (alkaline phosphatase superfamily)
VAVFAGLGGGFGFAFGNFLQVLGQVSGIEFNFWNLMEYSLGFFGGAGMAYGTFTSLWEEPEGEATRNGTLFPLLLLAVVIPFIVWDQSFGIERLTETFVTIGGSETIVGLVQWVTLLLILVLAVFWINKYYWSRPLGTVVYSHSAIKAFFLGHFVLYIVFSLLITGAFLSTYRIEQYLYLLNFGVILLMINKVEANFSENGLHPKKWGIGLVTVGLVVALLAFIAINTHDELPNAHKRFGQHSADPKAGT